MKVRILKWNIPSFGNEHIMPYGTLLVMNCDSIKRCTTKGDKANEKSNYQYITFNRKKYKVINKGSMYFPKIELEEMN